MRDVEPLDDATLLGRVAADPEALEHFYRRHIADITRFLARRCRTPEDVADAVSATFVAVLLSARTFDPALGSPMAWLYAIARNEAHRQDRSLGRREALRRRLQGSDLLSRDDAERIGEIIDAQREVGHLDEVLTHASPGELELVRSMATRDLSVTQASLSIGISAATGRKRLERLRRRVNGADPSTSDQKTQEER
jgi:RNA polymerase sigma-70 factor (ECF subfamily)